MRQLFNMTVFGVQECTFIFVKCRKLERYHKVIEYLLKYDGRVTLNDYLSE